MNRIERRLVTLLIYIELYHGSDYKKPNLTITRKIIQTNTCASDRKVYETNSSKVLVALCNSITCSPLPASR